MPCKFCKEYIFFENIIFGNLCQLVLGEETKLLEQLLPTESHGGIVAIDAPQNERRSLIKRGSSMLFNSFGIRH